MLTSPPNYCDAGPAIGEPRQKVLSVLIDFVRKTYPTAARIVVSTTDPGIMPNQHRTSRCNMVLSLGKNLHETMRLYSSSTRRKIRRSEERLEIILDESQPWSKFYPLYAATMNRKGAWVKSERFFRELMNQFKTNPKASLALAERHGETVAGMMYSCYKDKITLLYNGWLKPAEREHPNYALTQCVIKQAQEKNCNEVDFGLTPLQPSDGLYTFKARWGAMPQPIYELKISGRASRFLHNVLVTTSRIMPKWA